MATARTPMACYNSAARRAGDSAPPASGAMAGSASQARTRSTRAPCRSASAAARCSSRRPSSMRPGPGWTPVLKSAWRRPARPSPALADRGRRRSHNWLGGEDALCGRLLGAEERRRWRIFATAAGGEQRHRSKGRSLCSARGVGIKASWGQVRGRRRRRADLAPSIGADAEMQPATGPPPAPRPSTQRSRVRVLESSEIHRWH